MSIDAGLQVSSSSFSSMSPPLSSAQAPVATSRLVAPSGFVGSVGGTVTILLSTGRQDITIIDRPGTIALSGASGGNDIVRFAGAAASYTVTRSGSRVIISDGDTSVAIAVSGSPINLVFADGTRSLRANDNTVLIGNQVAGTTPAAISAVPDVAGVPAAGTPAVRGQLILAEGDPVVVSGLFDVFGTAAGAEVFTALSGDIAVRSGFAGGLDTIAFEAPASTFTATRTASQVIIEGPGLRISIPVSTAGVMLRFADDTRSLRFDSEAGQVVIGDQVIGNAPVTLSAAGAVSEIDLSELAPTQGFAIAGSEPGDRAGRSVSSAGDLNGDGFDDIVIGVTGANGQAGETYVLFGSAEPFPARTAGEDLTGANGFRILGQNPFGESGFSVSGAGDVNGDGLADLLIGAPNASLGGPEASYVIFGSTEAFGPTLALADLNGTNGFRIDGALPGSEAGFSVANAGDVNGDGIDDLIIGAHRAAASGSDLAGSSYIVFGSAQGFGASLDLAAPGASRVTRIDGGQANGLSGLSVASAGDVNGDGIDDVIIGGPGAEAAYVVFGSAGGLPPVVNLAGLNGTNGFRLAGAASTSDEGFSVAGIGDVNGDGIDDLAIGAPATAAGGAAAGATFVVFGSATPFAASLDLAALGLTAGFVISGSGAGDQAGFAVAGAGDVNGDGYGDLIIGARLNDRGGINAGEAYVVFGRPKGSATNLNVFDLDGGNGFRIQGAAEGDEAGFAVASAGDVNGDGFDDLIIGAAGTGGAGTERSGTAFVIYGGATGTENTATVSRTGTASGDNLIGNGGDDVLVGAGGADVIRGGAGNDRISIADLAFADIDGGRGTDTLALAGSGLTLDLTGSTGRRLDSIEAVDLTGSGNNRLIVSERAIYNLTEARSGGDARLIVTGNAGDIVEARGFVANTALPIGAFSRTAGDSTAATGPVQTIGGITYNVFVSGNSVLLAQQGVTVITNRAPVFASAATLTIRENQSAAFDADATDADGDTLTYALSGPDAARFSINPANGFVAFLTAPDFEAPGDANFDNRYQITVTVSDGRESTSQAVTVTVADVNEAPIFASGTTFSVAENTTAAFDADAVDPEGTGLTYSLSGTDAALFAINTATGVVTFRTAPNFERPSDANADNRYQITVTASDGSLSTDQAVTITVTDVNEAPTAVALNNQLASRAENSPSADAVKVADIAITDDALGTETITLTGADAAAFEVVNGELRLKAGTALNFEAKSSYAVTVNVVDAAIPGSTPVTANYTLTVTDVNEAPTAVVLNNQLAGRAENSPSAAAIRVADIAITDDALGTNAITLSGADAGFFEVVGTELRLRAGTALNFEAKSSYSVTVNVVDRSLSAPAVTANYTLNVIDVNEPPVAAADAFSMDENTVLSGNILTNDVDPDGNALTATVTRGPANGTVVLNATTGAFDYTPTRNFFGTDSFEYTISDGSLSSTATVTITVINVNEPPVGTADTYNTDEDTALTVTVANGVLVNDNDIDSDPLTAVLGTGPANGSLTLNTNGSFVYTPNANFSGTDSFTYRPNDGTEAGNLVTVTINVAPVNDAPVSVSDAYTLDEDSSITTTLANGVLSNDSDIEGSGLNAVLVSGPARGTLSFNANGTFTYTPIANANGTDSFTYRAFDDTLLGGQITTVTLAIRPVNDAPVGVNDSYTIAEDNTLTIAVPGLLGNDIDIDGDRLRVSSSTTSPATNGTLLLDPNGNFVFTPNRDFNGTATFQYSLTDGTVIRGPVQVTITVTPVNDAPVVAVPIVDQAVDEDTAVNFTVPAGTFTDVDSTTLTYSAALESGAALPSGLNFDATTRTFTGTPPLNFNGALSIRVTASDGTLTGSDVFTLTVRPVNDAPTVANAIANQAFDEDTAVNFTVPADTFADVDNATLTYSASLAGGGTLPTWLNFNATTRTFSGTPTPLNFNGALDIRVTASDGEFSANDVFRLTITPVNDAPDAVNDVATTDEDTAVTVSAASGLLANDTDVDAGTTLSITQINGAPVTFGTPIAVTGGGTVTVLANGSYVFNPNGAYEALRPTQTGTASFTYTISDGALTDTATATITIEGRNERPIAVNDTLTMTGNTPITITAASLLANDSDPDGTTNPAITLTAVGGATNGSVSLLGSSITFTPNTGFTGAASFTYTIRDADGATATGTVNVTVNGLVWYVDNSYANANGTSDGSFLRPFTSLAPLNGAANNGATTGDVDGANDTIFVARTGTDYTGGITLEAGQKLFGDGHEFTVNGIQIGSGVTTNPIINHSTSGITLSTDNEIRGLNVNGTANSAVGIQDGNGTVGSLVIAGVSVRGLGKAVDIDQGGTLAVALEILDSGSSSTEGVHLQGVSGSFTANSGLIQGSTLQGILVGAAGGGVANSGGNATISYGGLITNAGGSVAGIEIQDRSGGVVTFSGNISDNGGPAIAADGNAGTINFGGQMSISSGASTAISLTNNSAAINFTPTGNGLDITTTTGNGFIVDGGGGTVTLSGTGNTISTTSGRAVEIDGVTIGTGGVNFQSVNISTGGTTTGIFLRNAGSGGFTISGTGTTAGSGGTLRASGGSNATLEDGVGIYIENTNNISLSNLNFTGNFGDFGIRGNTVNGFTLRDSTFNAADADDGGFGDSSVDDEGVIRFTGLTGTALFEGNNISDGHEDVLRIDNSSGTLNLTVRDSSTNQAVIGRNGTTSGNDGIIVNGSGNSNITVLIDGVQFTGSRDNLIQILAEGTATQNVTIRNNTFANLHPDVTSGGGGITVALSGGTGGGPGVTYLIENNTFTGAEGTVILTQALGPAGQMSGRILNNVIGTPGGGYNSAQATTGTNGFGSGIEVRVEKGSGPSDLTHAVRIEGNTIRDISGDAAILLRSNGASDASGTARLEATIVNNTIAELGPNAFSGIFAQLGGSPGGGWPARAGYQKQPDQHDRCDVRFRSRRLRRRGFDHRSVLSSGLCRDLQRSGVGDLPYRSQGQHDYSGHAG